MASLSSVVRTYYEFTPRTPPPARCCPALARPARFSTRIHSHIVRQLIEHVAPVPTHPVYEHLGAGHIRREFLHPAGFSMPLSALYTICGSVRMCRTGVFLAQVASAISTAQNSASATLSTSNDRARTRPRVDPAAIPARCPVPSNASVATTMLSSMGWMIEFFSFRASAKSACSAGTTVLNLRTFLNSAGYSRTTALNKPTLWSVFPTATSKNHDVASFPTSTSLHTSARHSPRADSATTATSLSSA